MLYGRVILCVLLTCEGQLHSAFSSASSVLPPLGEAALSARLPSSPSDSVGQSNRHYVLM